MITVFHRAEKFVIYNLEAFIWIAAIIFFALSPVHQGNHFSICPLSLAGFQHCPGCGLGRAIVLFLHGRANESFEMHPFGILAFTLLIVRIVAVFKNYFNYQKRISIIESN